jgi:hypothetical protein
VHTLTSLNQGLGLLSSHLNGHLHKSRPFHDTDVFTFLMAEKEQGHRAGQKGKGIELPYDTTSSISIP